MAHEWLGLREDLPETIGFTGGFPAAFSFQLTIEFTFAVTKITVL